MGDLILDIDINYFNLVDGAARFALLILYLK